MAKKSFLDRLKQGVPLLADGALGTLLQQSGVHWKQCPEELVLQDSSAIARLVKSYKNAGAEILQTCTFGAHPERLASFGLENRAEEINRAAVRIVREVADEECLVAGVLGPAGFTSATPPTEGQIKTGYAKQAGWMLDEGIDLIVIESVLSVDEANLAIHAIQEVTGQAIPIVVSFSPVMKQGQWQTFQGEPLEEAIKKAEQEGVAAVGVNCGDGAVALSSLMRQLTEWTSLPLWYAPSAGVPVQSDRGFAWPENEQTWTQAAGVLINHVRVVGGCCGTAPAYIKTLRSLIDAVL